MAGRSLAKETNQQILIKLGSVGLAREFTKRNIIREIVRDEQVDREKTEVCMKQYRQRNHAVEDSQFKDYLRLNCMTVQDALEEATLSHKISTYARREYLAKAQHLFAKERKSFTRLIYSLIRVKNKGLAEELYLRVENNECAFTDLAAQFSEGPERETKGLVGPIPATKIYPAIASRLLSAQPGSVMPPFRVDHSWAIARLEKRYDPKFDEGLTEKLCIRVFMSAIDKKVDELLRTIGEEA